MIVIIAVCIVVLFLFSKSYTVVPARKVAIEERLGRYYRTLTPGWYFVVWPLSYLRTVNWSYVGQNNTRVKSSMHDLISINREQMDIPPIKCLTKDKIQVTVDGTVCYTITDPRKAVYESNDALNLFYQRVVQAVHRAVAKFEEGELLSEDVARLIEEIVNEDEEPIRLAEFVLQKIEMDQRILDANEAIYASARQQKMMLSQLQAEEELSKERRRIETEQLKHDLEVAKVRADARALDGFTAEQRIELERVKAFAGVMGSAEKIVYAPADFWRKSQFIKGGL